MIDPSRKNDGISIDDFLEISITQDSDELNENRITALRANELRPVGDIRIYPKSGQVKDLSDAKKVYEPLLSNIDNRFVTMETFGGKSKPDEIVHIAFDKGPKYVKHRYWTMGTHAPGEAGWNFESANKCVA